MTKNIGNHFVNKFGAGTMSHKGRTVMLSTIDDIIAPEAFLLYSYTGITRKKVKGIKKKKFQVFRNFIDAFHAIIEACAPPQFPLKMVENFLQDRCKNSSGAVRCKGNRKRSERHHKKTVFPKSSTTAAMDLQQSGDEQQTEDEDEDDAVAGNEISEVADDKNQAQLSNEDFTSMGDL